MPFCNTQMRHFVERGATDQGLGCLRFQPTRREITAEDGFQAKHVNEKWIPDSLQISGFTREQTLQFDDPKEVMRKFRDWLRSNSQDKLFFISDNNGFDWQFINYYFHHFLGKNPWGHSSTNLLIFE